MANDKQPAKPQPIIDVSGPGKTAPAGNSKSVIVTHSGGHMMQDPMVNQGDSTSDGEAPTTTPITLSVAKKPKIEPLKLPDAITEDTKSDDKPDEKKQDEPAPQSDEKPSETSTTDDSEKPADAQTDADKKAPDDREAPNPALAGKKVLDEDAAANEEAAKDVELQKLIDGKQYFLPIKTIESRRTRRTIILGVLASLILGAAWLDIALDAGLVHVGSVKPVTHFFSLSNEKTSPVSAQPASAAPALSSKVHYVSKVDGISLDYLRGWKLTEDNSGLIVENEKRDSFTLASLSRTASQPQASTKRSTIAYVNYTKTNIKNSSAGDTLYIRDAIYARPGKTAPNYMVRSSLAETKGDEKVGDAPDYLDTTFKGPDSQTDITFFVFGLPGADSGMIGFDSVDSAKDYMQSDEYQQNRGVLLSFKLHDK